MLSLAELQRRIDSGELSAAAAIAQSLEAIDAHEKAVGAFVCRPETVRAQNAGPLRGIAVGIKDIIDTADLATEMGSPIYKGWQPRADAPVVAMLKAAGATVAGKTTTTAFASVDPTATRNPRNPGHTPGGSSSGSAAAVAAGMIPLALGTQTGGSVIRPASFCGVAAIKPSFRLLPTVGVKCFSWTLDTVGLFAAGVKDLAHGLSAMTNRPELLLDAATRTPRIGVVRRISRARRKRQARRRCGPQRRRRNAPGRLFAISHCRRSSPRPGGSSRPCRILRRIRRWPGNTGCITMRCRRCSCAKLDETAGILPAAYDEARGIAKRARDALAEIFEGVDVLLTFSAPGAAPKGLASTGDPRFNRLWTLMGVPCVNVPALIADGGLPVGVQVIARFGDDAGALAAARFVEEALATS